MIKSKEQIDDFLYGSASRDQNILSSMLKNMPETNKSLEQRILDGSFKPVYKKRSEQNQSYVERRRRFKEPNAITSKSKANF
jgi:hypothetical protein